MNRGAGRATAICRLICCGALAAPLLYWLGLAYKGDAFLLLILAFLSLVAGLVLFVNSMFCLVRYRKQGQFWPSMLFTFVSVIGVVAMPIVLPGWKM